MDYKWIMLYFFLCVAVFFIASLMFWQARRGNETAVIFNAFLILFNIWNAWRVKEFFGDAFRYRGKTR